MGSGLSATIPAPVAKGFARGPEGLPTSGRADIIAGFAARAGCTAHAEHGPQHRQLPPALPAPVLEPTRVTESQNSRGWKGPLWVTQSKPLPKQGHLQ